MIRSGFFRSLADGATQFVVLGPYRVPPKFVSVTLQSDNTTLPDQFTRVDVSASSSREASQANVDSGMRLTPNGFEAPCANDPFSAGVALAPFTFAIEVDAVASRPFIVIAVPTGATEIITGCVSVF